MKNYTKIKVLRITEKQYRTLIKMKYTKEEFNKVTIDTLKSRGDHISLNAVKMIEEMQKEAINYTRCCKSDSEQLLTGCTKCNCSNAKDRLDCGFECYNK